MCLQVIFFCLFIPFYTLFHYYYYCFLLKVTFIVITNSSFFFVFFCFLYFSRYLFLVCHKVQCLICLKKKGQILQAIALIYSLCRFMEAMTFYTCVCLCVTHIKKVLKLNSDGKFFWTRNKEISQTDELTLNTCIIIIIA